MLGRWGGSSQDLPFEDGLGIDPDGAPQRSPRFRSGRVSDAAPVLG
jgi:hypothetical protein